MSKKKKTEEAAAEPAAAGESPHKVPAGSSPTVEAQKRLALKGTKPGHRQAKRAKEMRAFRLKRGVHFDARTGDMTDKGAVVKSDQALDVLEPDRYTAVAEEPGGHHPHVSVTPAKHPNAPRHPADEAAETAEDATATAPPPDAEDVEEEEDEAGTDDCTDDFPAAAAADVKVVKTKGGFNVVDADDLDTPLQGPRPLKTASAVEKFLAKTYGG